MPSTSPASPSIQTGNENLSPISSLSSVKTKLLRLSFSFDSPSSSHFLPQYKADAHQLEPLRQPLSKRSDYKKQTNLTLISVHWSSLIDHKIKEKKNVSRYFSTHFNSLYLLWDLFFSASTGQSKKQKATTKCYMKLLDFKFVFNYSQNEKSEDDKRFELV